MSKVLILYDTRTGNTGQMARAVAEGANSVEGVEVVLKKVRGGPEKLADADAIIVGSPTRNAQPSRAIKRFLSTLSNVSLQNKVGTAFGSYGWSGEAVEIVKQNLAGLGVRVVDKGVRIKKRPDAEGLARCMELGQTVAQSCSPGHS